MTSPIDRDTFTVSTTDMRRAHRYLRSERLFQVIKNLDEQMLKRSKDNRDIGKLREELWIKLQKADIMKEDFE